MAIETVYVLGASQLEISNGAVLSGITQGDGSHLVGETITLESNARQPVTINDNDTNFDDNDSSQQLDVRQTVDGTEYNPGTQVEAEYRLTLEDTSGNTYEVIGVNFNEGGSGPAFGTVEGLTFVGDFPPLNEPLTVVSAREGGSTPYADLSAPPCFVAGSLIDTPAGPVAVEALEVGDLVSTMDHGPQPLRWIGRVRVPGTTLRHDPRFRPVIVRRDAFGPGSPCRDMRLSQQHRVLLSGWRAELLFGEDEVLVPVTKLTNDTSIRIDAATAPLSYVHLLFDRHEIVWADGLPSESYFPDGAAQFGSPTRAELARLFPDGAAGPAGVTMARPCIQDRRARLLL